MFRCRQPTYLPTYLESITQLGLSFLLYAIFLILGLAIARTSYLLALPFAIATAAFLVRLFIIQHDCGHGSFFPSKKWNDTAGFFIGALTMTPYQCWRKFHAIHHAGSGNLDARGIGDVRTLTVREYYSLNWKNKFAYRFYRTPIVLFGLIPFMLFVFRQRLTYYLPKKWKKERVSVHWTNFCILLFLSMTIYAYDFATVIIFYGCIMAMAASTGVWLFYVQHQFEGAYWERHGNWSFQDAALKGSSYYKLPQPLEWLTASIGFHHIHHLNVGIPNYRLAECFRRHSELSCTSTLTLRNSLKCLSLRLWDEDRRRMVGFEGLKEDG